MKKTNKKGFTLIELLAVIAIIAIIGAIATPNVIKLINSSNQDQIISDAKLAISKAKYQFRKDFIENHQYNIYDKIIECCDLFCTAKFMTMDERLIEIMLRKGAHDNTVYHITYAQKLKKELEEKMGCNLYSLFPEIIKKFK